MYKELNEIRKDSSPLRAEFWKVLKIPSALDGSVSHLSKLRKRSGDGLSPHQTEQKQGKHITLNSNKHCLVFGSDVLLIANGEDVVMLFTRRAPEVW